MLPAFQDTPIVHLSASSACRTVAGMSPLTRILFKTSALGFPHAPLHPRPPRNRKVSIPINQQPPPPFHPSSVIFSSLVFFFSQPPTNF
ncbi:hypothetical protein BGS_1074 [Beggiatoa sp. SS]|nr:hypothetical protein BGS_1074 [Beggiatoa sp. SS]